MTAGPSTGTLGHGGPPTMNPGTAEEVATMTATLQHETTLDQLLGTVGETMTGELVLLAADAPAVAALTRLECRAISGAPVIDGGRVVGMLTRHDVLHAVTRQANPRPSPVAARPVEFS
jgi:CBS domain-containing protein